MAMRIVAASVGAEKMQEVAIAIQEGAKAYLYRQYSAMALACGIFTALLGLSLGLHVSLGFIIGSFLSGLSGYIAMQISVRANVRTIEAYRKGLKEGLDIAFKSGCVTGLLVIGFGLCGIAGYYMYLETAVVSQWTLIESLLALGFGASIVSIFARLGGGIFSKGVDVGSQLISNLEDELADDYSKDASKITDNIGNNVSNCLGIAADLFETYAVTIIGTMLMGSIFFTGEAQELMMLYPLIIAGICILTSILGMFFVRLGGDSKSIMMALYRGLVATVVLSVVAIYFATNRLLDKDITYSFGTTYFSSTSLFFCSLSGLIVTLLVVWITEYYTSAKYRPVRSVAKAATTGHGTNIIQGIAFSMEATVIPVIIICTGIISAYANAGLYGIAIMATTMLSMTGIIITMNVYGSVTDNAGKIAKMLNLPKNTDSQTYMLNAVGVAKSVTKGYAICSTAIASIILFSIYNESLKHYFPDLDVKFMLGDTYVLVGLFIGAMLPYLFSSMSMKAVIRVAGELVIEVRRQLKTIKGLMEGKAKPESRLCVDLLAKASIKEMVIPALLPFASPFILYYIIKAAAGQSEAFSALGSMLLGIIVSGLFVAISMILGGGAWENASKYIADGQHGGNGSKAHEAAKTGNMVGSPYKDTAGAAISPMIKIANIVTILLLAVA